MLKIHLHQCSFCINKIKKCLRIISKGMCLNQMFSFHITISEFGLKTVFLILFSSVIRKFWITDSIRFNLVWRSARLLSNSCISLYCTAIGLLPLGNNLYNNYIEMLPKNQRVLGSIVVNIKIKRGLYVAVYPPHLNRDFTMARYVHFDVRASRRSRKQIQPISSENIEICLVRFKSISSREHIHYFRKPAWNGTFPGIGLVHRLNPDQLRECMGFHRLNPC